jgi:hypothetical protein
MATTNTLGYFNPVFYAQEALIQLQKALGMAGRIHRGYDEERRSFNKGEYINIKGPADFTVGDAPAAAQNLVTKSLQLQLSYWREVKFSLTDKELAFTTEQIIAEHIAPAAYALADDIDQKLALLYKDTPWFYDLASTTAITDFTGPYQVLFDNKVPMNNLHYMVNGTLQNGAQSLAAFNQAYGAGQAGLDTLQRGSLGQKFGFEIFANQNVQSHTPGVCADPTGAIDFGSGTTAVYAKGAKLIHVDGVTSGGTFKAGDTFVIAGNTQRYAITADVTMTSGEGDIAFTPGLAAAVDEDSVVTGRIDTHTANLAFHRNAFALAMAPLTEIGNELGAKIAAVTDPVTGLSLRSRIYYVGNSSEVHVALDVLYGIKTLDENLACRCCG